MGNISLLKQAIAKKEQFIKANQSSENPQVKEMVIAAKAERDAFEACLNALRGDRSLLRIMARC